MALRRFAASLPDDFHQDAFATEAVEFPVEDLFPWAEIKLPFRDGHDHLAPHDGTLEMGIGVILGSVVRVTGIRLFRGQSLQPVFKIAMEARFVVIDEDACGDVHGIHETEPFADAAFLKATVDFRGDIEEAAPGWNLKPKLVTVRFHGFQHKLMSCVWRSVMLVIRS